MEEARGGNGYSYVGRNDSPEVPELQYEAPASARRPSWAWYLLAAPLLAVPFFVHQGLTRGRTEARTEEFAFDPHFHTMHTIHTGSSFGGSVGEDSVDMDGSGFNSLASDAGLVDTVDGSSFVDATHGMGGFSSLGSDMDGIHSVHLGPYHGIHTVHTGSKEIVVKHHYLTQEKAIHVPVPGADHVVVDKVYAHHSHYSCGAATSSSEFWSAKHKAWCCWKFHVACPSHVVNQDKYVHVVKTNPVPVPHYYHVPVPAQVPEPVRVPTPIPSMPLPPRQVQVPVPVPGEIPRPIVHYQYHTVPEPYKVPHVVYDRERVPVPMTVNKYVKEFVPERPEVIYKTRHVVVPEAHFNCHARTQTRDMWSKSQQRYCCWKHHIACPQTHYMTRTRYVTHVTKVKVPVPSPPKIIVRKHEEHHELQSFDCTQGFSNWWKGWSPLKKKYCCAHERRGCPGAAHGHMHVEVHHVAVAAGGKKTYDCNAGFSNWLQGWSDSKKTWCCANGGKGCVKHHCFTGDIANWAQDKQEWCCSTYQRGCPHTTLSPLGCDAVCELHGESSTCKDRIHWVKANVFGEQSNSCNLAYSKVQVDCDVCRACSAAAAGCSAVVGVQTSAAFDCNAALGNFARAWSPPKKQWCCSTQGKGCEGDSPPSVSAGAGMTWKHVQVNGFWTWTAVHMAGAATATALPYDCHAGLANWKLGWSAPKKTWCCSKQKMGCPGSAGGMGAGGAASSSWSVHWTSSHGKPPSSAGNGMMWTWSKNHWTQVHFTGRDVHACHGPGLKPHFCCYKYGICR